MRTFCRCPSVVRVLQLSARALGAAGVLVGAQAEGVHRVLHGTEALEQNHVPVDRRVGRSDPLHVVWYRKEGVGRVN